MATSRSEQDLLSRLRTSHLRGGRDVFLVDLADIRTSRIMINHDDIFNHVMRRARALSMQHHDVVRKTRRHIANERLKLRKAVGFASGNGHAVVR